MTGPHPPQPPTESGRGHHDEGVQLSVIVLEAGFYGSGSLRQACDEAGLAVEWAHDVPALIRRLRLASYQAIVISLPVPGMEPAHLYREIVALDPELTDRLIFIAHDLGDPATRHFLADAGRPFLTRPVTAEAIRDLVLRMVRDRRGNRDQNTQR